MVNAHLDVKSTTFGECGVGMTTVALQQLVHDGS